METRNEDEITRMVKKVFPQIMALAKDKVCPSEEALAAFAEGKLKGRKEEEVIFHLALCNDCLETINFLRQAPSEEEVSVPIWLEKTVRDLFPEKPKTWKITIERAKTALEVIRHTAAECFTIPGFELVPAKMQLQRDSFELATVEHLFRSSDELDAVALRPIEQGLARTIQEKKKSERKPHEEALADIELGYAEGFAQLRAPIPTVRDNILKSLGKKISNGFVFSERIGPFKLYLVVAKKEGKRPHTFEVAIVVHDRSGKFAEDIEILFLQGRKEIDKLVTTKKGGISKKLAPQNYTVKFKYKGFNLGKAFLDLREERTR
jgi:hypothetical protein